MGREASITFEQVASVADQIQRETGKKPTTRAVRELLGSGSLGTIVKFLQQWQAGQARTSDQVIDDALDPAIGRSIVNAIGERVKKATGEATSRIADLQVEISDLAKENERQAEEIEDLLRKVNELESSLANSTGRMSQLEAELSHVRAERDLKAEESERLRADLAKSSLKLESVPRLEETIQRLENEIKKMEHSSAEAEKRAAVAESRAQSLSGQIDELKDRVKVLEPENSSLRESRSGLEKQISTLEAQAAGLRVQISRIQELNGEIEKLKGENEQREKRWLEVLDSERSNCQNMLKDKDKIIEKLLDSAKKPSDPPSNGQENENLPLGGQPR